MKFLVSKKRMDERPWEGVVVLHRRVDRPGDGVIRAARDGVTILGCFGPMNGEELCKFGEELWRAHAEHRRIAGGSECLDIMEEPA